MCHTVKCRRCGKTTWAGCGQHVNQVMRSVPRDARCKGHQNDPAPEGGFFAKIFGR